MAIKERIEIPIPSIETPQASRSLAVPQFQQEQSNWCWSACYQMIFRYGNFDIRQCKLAEYFFKANCCKSPGNCNRTLPDSEITVGFSHWGYNCNYTATQKAFGDIQNSINISKPLEAGLSWRGGGGHVVIISGWQTNGSNKVLVLDPGQASGPGLIDYTFLQSAYGMGVWDATWSNIAPK